TIASTSAMRHHHYSMLASRVSPAGSVNPDVEIRASKLASLLQFERRQPQLIAPGVALRKQPFDRRRRQWSREVIALTGDAPNGSQRAELLGPLDAVRHRHHPPGVAEVDARPAH